MRARMIGALSILLLTIACTTGPRPAVPQPVAAVGTETVIVLKTNKGSIKVELFHELAPVTVQNFLKYAREGFYDGVIFHRVIEGFMIQTGGFNQEMVEKGTLDPIKNEATNGLSNSRGTLAMARTDVVDSATSQFFINLVDNKRLDHRGLKSGRFGYAVFGRVLEGLDVVDSIGEAPVLCSSSTSGQCRAELPDGMQDVPAEAIVIEEVKVL